MEKDYVKLDRAMLPALEKAIKGHPEIEREVQQWRHNLDMKGKLISFRRIIWIIYDQLTIDDDLFDIIGIKHLTNLRWPSKDTVDTVGPWLDHWIRISNMIDPAPPMRQKRDLLWQEVKKSNRLKLYLVKYRDTPKDDGLFDTLVAAIRKRRPSSRSRTTSIRK